jgi:hypothetical protein
VGLHVKSLAKLKFPIILIVKPIRRALAIDIYKDGVFVDYLQIKCQIYKSYNKFILNKIVDLIKVYNIGLVHIHHLYGYPLEILNLESLSSIPVIFTIHDFYLYYGNLSTQRTSTLSNNNIKHISNLLQQPRLILFPSKYIANLYLSRYELSNYKSIELGTHYQQIKLPSNLDQITIAYVGMITYAKGFVEYCKLASKLYNYNIRWIAIGNKGYDYDQIVSKYSTNMNIKVAEYNNDLQQQLIKYKPSFVIMPNINQEAYCSVLSEILICGISIIASKGNAIEYRLQSYNVGLLYDNFDDLICLVKSIIQHPELIIEQKRKIYRLSIKSETSMLEEFVNIYYEYGNILPSPTSDNTKQKHSQNSHPFKNQNIKKIVALLVYKFFDKPEIILELIILAKTSFNKIFGINIAIVKIIRIIFSR